VYERLHRVQVSELAQSRGCIRANSGIVWIAQGAQERCQKSWIATLCQAFEPVEGVIYSPWCPEIDFTELRQRRGGCAAHSHRLPSVVIPIVRKRFYERVDGTGVAKLA
jgi:hypothetical protein